MIKVLIACCLLAAVAFAGTTNSSCTNGVEMALNELYEGDTRAFDFAKIQCGTYKYEAQGQWYHFVGRGAAVVLDTCDQRTSYDSVIFVFNSCKTDDQGYINSCVAMDDDGCNQRQSRVVFTAEALHHYYIFVSGFLNSTGIYYLATSQVLPPDNYKCTKAIEVDKKMWSIEGETGTCLAVRDTCQDTWSSGLWYQVHGNGAPFVAHTCNANTNYDTIIAVFNKCTEKEGADECITWNNDACYRASLVSWRSVQHNEYYVFVTGLNNARGRFTLAIEERSMNPYSHCYEPIVVTSIPFYYSNQTNYLETTYSECRGEDGIHAMYFRMNGGNRKVVVTTCTSSSTVNDTVIDIYARCEPKSSSAGDHPGSGKVCVASNDDYCGLGASVVFFATANTYYIAVSSVSPSIQGVAFSLAIMPYEETANTQCWFAEDVDSFPDVFIGNTTGIESCEQSCDGSRTSRRGGWYRYTHLGDKKTLTATTCNRYNMLPVKLEVYNDCNEMSCVAQAGVKDDCTTVTFVAENGKTYNIFVTAEDPNNPGGYYHVDFYEEANNTHGTCEDAYFVNLGSLPYRVEDNTITSPESYSDCVNKSKKGVWVSVLGTGNKIVATTCDPHTDLDTVLELYNHCPDASDPHHEYCLDANDDSPSCNRASEIEWLSEKGAYYWIFVTGFSSNTGIFVLKIYEKVSMPNAKCNTAVGVRSLPYYDFGLTTYCDMCNASCTPRARKGNWYEIVGNDHWVTISTCNIETDFATEIEVYLACNSDYGSGEICVNHNHDYKCSPKTEITFAAVKDQLFFIFVTGVDEAVMSEGFFGVTITEGDKLPSHSSESEGGLTGGQGFLVAIGVFMGIGVVVAVCAVGYGLFKRRHVSYQEITPSSD